jgi:hypothetical protein
MRKLFPILMLLALGTPVAAQDAASRGRPMQEMRGGCDNFAIDLRREFSVWDAAPQRLTAAPAEPAADAIAVQASRPADIALLPDGAYRLAPQAGQDRRAEGRFGGEVTVEIPAAGQWRVSAGPGGVWYDLMGPQGPLHDPRFEMQTRCTSIFKTVVFAVPSPGRYRLAINGNAHAVLRILVSPEP